MEIKNILVTGSDGYIGAVLVPILIKNKFNVVGLDCGYFKKSIIGDLPLKFNQINKDIRKISDKDLRGFDAIIHLAALSNDPLGQIDPKITEEINYKATIALAKLAKKTGVKRFIFSSSCSIYGIARNGIVSEKSKVNPLTAYAKSKIKAEKSLQHLASKDFCVCILRNSTVYGFSPKLRADLVVNDFVTKAVLEKTITVLSDGTPWRPLIDVRDLCEIFVHFLNAETKIVNKQIYNIGFKENNLQIKTVLEAVNRELPNCKVVYAGKYGKDVRSYKVKFSKFHKVFPQISQKWPLGKSINDLAKNIKNGNISDISKYFRLNILTDLIAKKTLDKQLYWR